MNSGRHFNPPTPAYRPLDPFSDNVPKAAEQVPSCEVSTPPPARGRPVRIEPASQKETPASSQSEKGASGVPVVETTSQGANKHYAMTSSENANKKVLFARQLAAKNAQKKRETDAEETRKCELDRCKNTFTTKKRNGQPIKRFCSATCRGRASESRHVKA